MKIPKAHTKYSPSICLGERPWLVYTKITYKYAARAGGLYNISSFFRLLEGNHFYHVYYYED